LIRRVVRGKRPSRVSPRPLRNSTPNSDNAAQSTSQAGQYYSKAHSADNSAGPLWFTITASSTLGGSSTSKAFLPKYALGTAAKWTYDDDGNLTRDDQWSYTWDAENRLIAIETRNDVIGAIPSADARRLEFTYDYLGRRIEKVVKSGWNGAIYATVSSRTRFVYDGWNLIGEYTVSGSTVTLARSYTWGLDISRTLSDAGGVRGLLMISEVATGANYHPAYDGNGNVAVLVNRSTGTLDAAYEYSPFGETIRATGTYADKNCFRFSTHYTDSQTRLVYFGHRYYDPALGRWLGRDPAGEKGGLNLYSFIGNDVINRYDVLGMMSDAEIANLQAMADGCDERADDLIAEGDYYAAASMRRQADYYRSQIQIPAVTLAPFEVKEDKIPKIYNSTEPVTTGNEIIAGSGGGGDSPEKTPCDILFNEMNAAFKRFDGHLNMYTSAMETLMAMGGEKSVIGGIFAAAGKQIVDNVVGIGAGRLAHSAVAATREVGLALDMTYNSVNAFYETASNLGDGDVFAATVETSLSVVDATKAGAELYGAMTLAGQVGQLVLPGKAYYDWGKVAVQGSLGALEAAWHNGEFKRVIDGSKHSLNRMDVELGTMSDLMGLLEEKGCK